LKDALAQAGLVEGRNIEIVFRYANGVSNRLAELAAELVAQSRYSITSSASPRSLGPCHRTARKCSAINFRPAIVL